MIDIEELIPLLKKGYVAMDCDGEWYWHTKNPILYTGVWFHTGKKINLCDCFNIKPFDGRWQNSLRKVG